MIICHCNAATDRDIRRCASRGEGGFGDVAAGCRAGTTCGGCVPAIQAILQRLVNERPGGSSREGKRPD